MIPFREHASTIGLQEQAFGAYRPRNVNEFRFAARILHAVDDRHVWAMDDNLPAGLSSDLTEDEVFPVILFSIKPILVFDSVV